MFIKSPTFQFYFPYNIKLSDPIGYHCFKPSAINRIRLHKAQSYFKTHTYNLRNEFVFFIMHTWQYNINVLILARTYFSANLPLVKFIEI